MGQGDAAADWNRQRWLALITGRGSECQVHTWGHPPAEAPGNEVDPARLTAAVPGRCHRGQIPSVAVAAGRTGLWVWTGAPPPLTSTHTSPFTHSQPLSPQAEHSTTTCLLHWVEGGNIYAVQHAICILYSDHKYFTGS